MLKKVVIPSSNKAAILFLEDIKLKKEEAKKKIELRTEGLRKLFKNKVSAS